MKNDDKFQINDDHNKSFSLLFSSHNIEQAYKVSSELRYTVISGKEEQRTSSMLTSANELGKKAVLLQARAMSGIAFARCAEEAFAASYGLIELKPSGIAICPTCLEQAILTAQENLQVLKDIMEATKKYATVNS